MNSMLDIRDKDLGIPIRGIDAVASNANQFVRQAPVLVASKVGLTERLSQLSDYLAHKSVAVVGRASYLAHRTYGKEIDEFEEVVRIHHWHIHRAPEYKNHLPEHEHLALSKARYIPPFYHRHIGSKTSILYWRLQWMDYGTLTNTLEVLTHDNVKWIGVETFAEMAYAAAQLHYIEQYWGPIHVIPVDFFADVSARLHYAEPLPGTVIAAFMAQTQARHIKIFGCPCYQDNEGKREHAKLSIMGKHNTIADFYYMKQLVQRDPRVECDDVMKALFDAHVT